MKNVLAALAAVSLLAVTACSGGSPSNTDGGSPGADGGAAAMSGGGGGTGGGTGGGGGGGGGGLATSAQQAATAKASLECYGLSCLFVISPGHCDALGPFGPGGYDVAASVSAGRTAYDPVKGQACVTFVQGVTAQPCTGENSPLAGMSSSGGLTPQSAGADCDGMFTGTVDNGSSCYDGAECASGYCDFGAKACPGTCTGFKAAGASCGRDAECQPGLDCESGTCVAPLAKGASCGAGTSGSCADGLYCDSTGKCSDQKLALGAACTENAACPADAICLKPDPMADSGVCAARKAAGQPCNSGGFFFFAFSSECRGLQVCAGLQTDPATQAVTHAGTCAAPQGVGGTCFPSATAFGGNGCFIDLVCDPATQKCAAPPAAGQACVTGRCAADAYCNGSGTCAAKKADGASCAGSDECKGSCSSGTCVTQPDTTCKP